MGRVIGSPFLFGGGGGGYTQNIVDINGGYLSSATFGAGNQAQKTLSFWLRPNSVSGTQGIEEVSGRGLIKLTNAKLSVEIEDNLGTGVYSSLSTADVFSVGVWAHVYIGIDLSVPSLEIKINGSDVTMDTAVSSISAGNGLIDFDRTTYLLGAGAFVPDADIADLIIDDSLIANSTLYNGGAPPDPESVISTPLVLLGGSMDYTDWNSGTNLGSGGSFTVGSATFAAG